MLPIDAIRIILKYANVEELFQIRRVCKSFKQAADPLLPKLFFQSREFSPQQLLLPQKLQSVYAPYARFFHIPSRCWIQLTGRIAIAGSLLLNIYTEAGDAFLESDMPIGIFYDTDPPQVIPIIDGTTTQSFFKILIILFQYENHKSASHSWCLQFEPEHRTVSLEQVRCLQVPMWTISPEGNAWLRTKWRLPQSDANFLPDGQELSPIMPARPFDTVSFYHYRDLLLSYSLSEERVYLCKLTLVEYRAVPSAALDLRNFFLMREKSPLLFAKQWVLIVRKGTNELCYLNLDRLKITSSNRAVAPFDPHKHRVLHQVLECGVHVVYSVQRVGAEISVEAISMHNGKLLGNWTFHFAPPIHNDHIRTYLSSVFYFTTEHMYRVDGDTFRVTTSDRSSAVTQLLSPTSCCLA